MSKHSVRALLFSLNRALLTQLGARITDWVQRIIIQMIEPQWTGPSFDTPLLV